MSIDVSMSSVQPLFRLELTLDSSDQACPETRTHVFFTFPFPRPSLHPTLLSPYPVVRYLLGLVLRRRQVELVNSLTASAAQGTSCVQQMIMGAGKTTVISALLVLMLADEESSVFLAVPPSLLAQSRDIMRLRFSTTAALRRVYVSVMACWVVGGWDCLCNRVKAMID
jgi:hypothetical protein